MNNKIIIATVVIVIAVIAGIWFFTKSPTTKPPVKSMGDPSLNLAKLKTTTSGHYTVTGTIKSLGKDKLQISAGVVVGSPSGNKVSQVDKTILVDSQTEYSRKVSATKADPASFKDLKPGQTIIVTSKENIFAKDSVLAEKILIP